MCVIVVAVSVNSLLFVRSHFFQYSLIWNSIVESCNIVWLSFYLYPEKNILALQSYAVSDDNLLNDVLAEPSLIIFKPFWEVYNFVVFPEAVYFRFFFRFSQ